MAPVLANTRTGLRLSSGQPHWLGLLCSAASTPALFHKEPDQPTQINLLNHHAAKRLRQLREQLKLSRPKFADQLGIPPTTLKNYELGYREIGGGLFLLIANHPELKRQVDWLLTGIATPEVQA